VREIVGAEWSSSRTFIGRLDGNSAAGAVELPAARRWPLGGGEAAEYRIRASSPDVFLELRLLDEADRTIVQTEEGSMGFVELRGEQSTPVRSVVLSAREGSEGHFDLVVEERRTLGLEELVADRGVLGEPYLRGFPLHGEWLRLEGEGTTIGLEAASELPLLMVSDAGAVLGYSSLQDPLADLVMGAELRLAEGAEAVLEMSWREGDDMPPPPRTEVTFFDRATEDDALLVASTDGVFRVARSDLERPDGRSLDPRQAMELEVRATEIIYLVVPVGTSELKVWRSTLLARNWYEGELEASNAVRVEHPELRSNTHEVDLEGTRLVELRVNAGEEPQLELRLRDAAGRHMASSSLDDRKHRLLAWIETAGSYQIEVVGPTEGAPVDYRIALRQGTGRVEERRVDLLVAEPMTVREVDTRFSWARDLEGTDGEEVLVEWAASDCPGSFLKVRDGNGSELLSTGGGQNEAPRLFGAVTFGTDGLLSLVAGCDEGASAATLVARRLHGETTPMGEVVTVAPADPPLAPAFRFRDEDGGVRTSSDLRGKVVVLEFWASWCLPCRDSLPGLETLHRDLEVRGLRVLGINDEGTETIDRVSRDLGLSFHTISDRGSDLGRVFDVDAIPRTIVLSPTGRVIGDLRGGGRGERVRAIVTEALAGPGVRAEPDDGPRSDPSKNTTEAALAGPHPIMVQALRKYYGLGTELDEQGALIMAVEACAGGDPLARVWMELRYEELDISGIPAGCLSLWEAVDALEKRGAAGTPEEQWGLGLAHLHGYGIPGDPEIARRWWVRAAKGGFPAAYNSLGWLYRSELSHETRARSISAQWFQRGAEAGNASAMNNLGVAFLEGVGVEIDPDRARSWFEQAVQWREPWAAMHLAELYLWGRAVPQNEQAARLWLAKATAWGLEAARERQATRLEGRLVVPPGMGSGRVEVILERAPEERLAASTDSEGRFLFHALPGGTYLLYTASLDFPCPPIRVEVGEGQELEIEIEVCAQVERANPVATVRAADSGGGTWVRPGLPPDDPVVFAKTSERLELTPVGCCAGVPGGPRTGRGRPVSRVDRVGPKIRHRPEHPRRVVGA
jgi:TPR repeat protein/peroxiredoxin